VAGSAAGSVVADAMRGTDLPNDWRLPKSGCDGYAASNIADWSAGA